MSLSALRLREITLPTITLSGPGDTSVSDRVVDALIETGVAIVKSPFVDEDDNRAYLDMLTPYFGRSDALLRGDVREDVARQVGLTEKRGEDFSESQFFHEQHGAQMLVGDRAPYPHNAPNAHMRFFWRYGERPSNPTFAESHADPVIPEGIPEWETTMNGWGKRMRDTGELIAAHIENGMGLSTGSLLNMLACGPHLVAPTATELAGLPLGTVTSDVHTDFNPLTIHGAARFPTLICWTKAGTPFLVRVPSGCLLVQAGVGLEWVTGGAIHAGYHQTVILPETLIALNRAKADGVSTMRVSSTFFLHFNWEGQLKVFPECTYPGAEDRYPPMLVGEHALQVITAIGLKRQQCAG